MVAKCDYTLFPLTRLPLTGLLVNRTVGVPVIRTVPLTGVRLTGTEYTKFVNQTTGSAVNEKSGYRESGYRESGYRESGYRESGYRESG